jgi:type IV pilus assembly protein PilB
VQQPIAEHPRHTADGAEGPTERIGEILVRSGAITPEQLSLALKRKSESDEMLGSVLISMRLVDQADIVQAVAQQLNIPVADLSHSDIDPAAVKLVPIDFCRRYRVVPIRQSGEVVTIAAAYPTNVVAMDLVRAVLAPRRVEVTVARESEIMDVLAGASNLVQMIRDLPTGPQDIPYIEHTPGQEEIEGEAEELASLGGQRPIVSLVNHMVSRALDMRASDIHIEPDDKLTLVRCRVDGVLHHMMELPKYVHRMVIARIKVMSGMDIVQSRAPQDGHCSIRFGTREAELRISTLPLVHGEKAVLRLIPRDQAAPGLDTLGFSVQVLDSIRRMLGSNQGIILVTGPTGSGKTTTLHAALGQLQQNGEPNITAIEDPVERLLPGLNQMQINERAGVTFASALRSVLRQDPDVIMVGEMRDAETASIAFQSALTGHLVLSTLHTTDAVGAIIRLFDLGVDRSLISAGLLGVVAQRLVRRICGHCKQPVAPDETLLLAAVPWLSSTRATMRFFKGEGCERCAFTGYYGRTAIAELLPVTTAISRLVLTGADEQALERTAQAAGMRPMRAEGVRNLLSGSTSLDEILRVLPMDAEGTIANAAGIGLVS